MLQMFANSLQLFFKGKLFRDNGLVFKQWLKGFALTLVVMLAVGFAVTPLIGVIAGALAGGAAQPYLFKDLKYS
jgi:hypothetical protein